MTATPDPRLNAFRAGLADARLRGRVQARRFTAGDDKVVLCPVAPVREAPHDDAPLATQALYGETLRVFEERDGWAWGQLAEDGYVGYTPSAGLRARRGWRPTHYVAAPSTFRYREADLKTPVLNVYSMMSRVTVAGMAGDYAALSGGGFVFARHLRPLPVKPAEKEDPAAVAQRFAQTPYLWGGKSRAGLDCSGLVQLSWQACGQGCPRDTDMMARQLGEPMPFSSDGTGIPLRRNDLVFWRGHVGLMLDRERLIHANGHHMLTVIEPLAAAVARIAALHGPVTGVRRAKL